VGFFAVSDLIGWIPSQHKNLSALPLSSPFLDSEDHPGPGHRSPFRMPKSSVRLSPRLPPRLQHDGPIKTSGSPVVPVLKKSDLPSFPRDPTLKSFQAPRIPRQVERFGEMLHAFSGGVDMVPRAPDSQRGQPPGSLLVPDGPRSASGRTFSKPEGTKIENAPVLPKMVPSRPGLKRRRSRGSCGSVPVEGEYPT